MRANEFVTEAKSATRARKRTRGEAHPEREHGRKQPRLNPDQAAPMQGIHKARDAGGYDRIYHMNRLMMAMASADGRSHDPVDMDASSWTDKYNTIHPYTDIEENMVHQAFATVPSDHKHEVAKKKSEEPEHVHKISPVAGFKGYDR